MKTKFFIYLVALLILPTNLALAQGTTVASQPDTKTDPGIEEKIANGQVIYTVYEVHDLGALIAIRKAINLKVAEKDRPLAHGKFLAFNPRIVEQVSGGELVGNELNLKYYKKPCILLVVLTQRFKMGQLGAAVINVTKQTKTVTVIWTGKKMTVEVELYQGRPV